MKFSGHGYTGVAQDKGPCHPSVITYGISSFDAGVGEVMPMDTRRRRLCEMLVDGKDVASLSFGSKAGDKGGMMCVCATKLEIVV